MIKQNNSQQGIRFLVIAAELVIIVWGINQAQSVLVSFLVAVFFAIIGTPPILWLERKLIPSVAAVLIVVAGMITADCLSLVDFLGKPAWSGRYGFVHTAYHDPEVCMREQ